MRPSPQPQVATGLREGVWKGCAGGGRQRREESHAALLSSPDSRDTAHSGMQSALTAAQKLGNRHGSRLGAQTLSVVRGGGLAGTRAAGVHTASVTAHKAKLNAFFTFPFHSKSKSPLQTSPGSERGALM